MNGMTRSFQMGGFAVMALGALGGAVVLIYWWVTKFRPESHFSMEVKRLFELYLLTTQPEKVLGEAAEPPPPDRASRVDRASRRLKRLVHGDHLLILNQIYVVVSEYLIKELRQVGLDGKWTHEPNLGDQEFDGAELEPLDADPQGEGAGWMLIQLSLVNGKRPLWLLLKRYEYTDGEQARLYGAAKAYGVSLQAVERGENVELDRTPFELETADGAWAVSTIGMSRWEAQGDGAYFPDTVQVAHVLFLAVGLKQTDPNSVAVWLDGREPGTAGDWLGIGQVVDPQIPQVFAQDGEAS